MSDPESIGTSLAGRSFPQKPKEDNETTNNGTGPYAIPDYKPRNSLQQLAFDTAKSFNKLDNLKYFVKYAHHFKEAGFRRLLAKLNEATDVLDNGKYLNAIIQEELAKEKEKLAKKEENRDNSIK